MKNSRLTTAICAAVLPFALAFAAQGCDKKDDETPPPTPSAAPTPAPTPSATAPVQLQTEEDAGADAAADAAADASAVKTGGGGDATGIRACCSALRQNANSAPLDQKGPLLQAAAVCDGLVNSPQGRAALSQVRGMLAGAGAPAACK